jgi:DNA-binding NarL/FixJ family response regulator
VPACEARPGRGLRIAGLEPGPPAALNGRRAQDAAPPRCGVAVQCRDQLLRELLGGWLDRLPGLTVRALVTEWDELARLRGPRRPGLVVLEADTAGCDSAALLARLREDGELLVVGLHGGAGRAGLHALGRAGFDALVDSRDGVDALLGALRLLLPAAAGRAAAGPGAAGRARLTARELEVLELLGRSLRSAEIAAALGISARTVENHKRRVFAKLNVHSAAHAVAVAAGEGLLGGGARGAAPGDADRASVRERQGPRQAPAEAQLAGLTPREREILLLAIAGRSVKQTAHTLGVSVKTVESIQQRLFRTLGVRGRTGAVAAFCGLTSDAARFPVA